jgi:recombining binding protein suppressor of hairless
LDVLTGFPLSVKYLPPDRAAEVPKMHMNPRQMMKPDPRTTTMLTVYGENFSKTDPPMVFFGTELSPYVDVRCQEVLACMPPEVKAEPGVARPIFIVRSDGIIYPSSVFYHGK